MRYLSAAAPSGMGDIAPVRSIFGCARRTAHICLLVVALLVLAGPPVGSRPALAQQTACTSADFDAVVDETAGLLRSLNAASETAIDERILKLAQKRRLEGAQLNAETAELLSGPRFNELDTKIAELFGALESDSSAEVTSSGDCEKLEQLRLKRDLLLDLMREKSALSIARLDAALEDPAPGTRATENESATADKPKQERSASTTKPASPPVQKAPAAPSPSWQTEASRETPDTQAATPGDQAALQTPSTEPLTMPQPGRVDGFTADEILAAGRGFFGTISSGLASVINYAFQKAGRPTAYILGTEGGGAFIAGLRYGEGTITLRDGHREKIYWRGPSLGYDFGAEGSRTMILVYDAPNPADVHGRFTGIDGSAYLVGGVGVTFLKRRNVVLAPIRSGLGLRFGANIGYLKFSPSAGWNPF